MTTSAAQLSVDRLALHVPAMSEEEARRLAELVAQALSRWPEAPAASGRVASVKAQVEGGTEKADTAALADRIAQAALEAALRELH
jgi:hypothetical protein